VPFQHSCFISYCRVNGELGPKFIGDLVTALENYTGVRIDQKPFRDTHMRGGQFIDDSIAEAICRSVCMILVYTPNYPRHEYCRREYAAMKILEAARLPKIQPLVRDAAKLSKQGLIIPIVLRGWERLPGRIGGLQSYDFSQYRMNTSSLGRNKAFVPHIESIAETIEDLLLAFESLEDDPCADCGRFTIPAADEAQPWTDLSRPLPFPLRTW
jgi:hypothetical protein